MVLILITEPLTAFFGEQCITSLILLQPENILCMTKSGNRIKIIDFGLARKFEPMRKLQVCSLKIFCLTACPEIVSVFRCFLELRSLWRQRW